MATGYDNRQPTRASFAFKPAAARAGGPTPGGTAASVRGGAAGQRASQQGSVQGIAGIDASIGTSIPGFLEKVFEPVIQAASVERMYQGVAAALDGKTMQEIGEDQPFLAGLFGQTDFERGASFQHAQQGVQNWQAEQLARMDELKRLDPKDVGKVLFEAANTHMTGDRNTDNAIHRMVLEASTTLIPAVTTARIEHRRSTLRNGQVGVITGQGRNVGMLRDQFTSVQLGEGQVRPSREAVELAEQQAMQAFILPDGMPLEDWNSVVEQSARAFIAEGNIHMLNLMDRGGQDSLLFRALGATGDGAAFQTLQGQIEALRNKTLDKAAMEFIPELADLEANQIAGLLKPGQFYKRAQEINAQITERTGVENPYFDADEILQGEGGVVRAIVARNDEARRRAQSLADAAANRAADQAAKDEVDRINQREASALFKLGDINAALAAGSSKEDLDRAAYAAYQAGDIKSLVNAAATSNETGVFNGVKQSLQAPLSGAQAGVTPDFERSYRTWQAMYAEGTSGPHVAGQYYGQYHAGMLRYHNLVKGGRPPEDAHRQAFVAEGGRGTSPRTAVPQPLRAAVTAQADTLLGRNRLGAALGLTPNVTDGGRRVAERLLGEEAARIAASSDLSPEEAARQAAGVIAGSGRLETYGGLAWENVPGTGRDQPLTSYVPGLTPDVIGRNLNAVLERKLTAEGINVRDTRFFRWPDLPWAPGLNPNIDTQVVRLPDQQGAAQLWVTGFDKGSGKTISVLISSGEIMQESRAAADLSRRQREWDAQYSPTARGIGFRESQRRINMNPIGTGRGDERPERPTR